MGILLVLKCAHSATYCISLHLYEVLEFSEEFGSNCSDLYLMYQVFTHYTGITARTYILHVKASTVKQLNPFFSLETRLCNFFGR